MPESCCFFGENSMLLRRFRGLFSNDLAIDLGTTNTVIYSRGHGVVLHEPSVVAIRQDQESGRRSVVAVGHDARRMLGRTPQSLHAVRPMKDGVISDFRVTEQMVRQFVHKVHGSPAIRPSPLVMIGVPCGSTQVERRALKEVAAGAGAREVHLLDTLMAAALGAGLPVHEPRGSMVLDIGGGTTEVAVVSLNGIVYSESVRLGGDTFNDAITRYVRRAFGSLIGPAAAEHIKQQLGSAFPASVVTDIEVKGRHLTEGMPRSFRIDSSQVLEALQEPLMGIVTIVKHALEQTPPELGGDVAERGIMLTGGGALLRGVDRLIAEETGLPVVIAEDPLTCVARGTDQAFQIERHAARSAT